MIINKSKKVSSALKKDFNSIITKMYIEKKMCASEIADEIVKKTEINISPRFIQQKLKSLGIIRSFSEAFNLSIKKGRKNYNHLKKPIKSSEFRKGINLKLRYKILKRDNYKCVLCGKSAKDTILVIDHIIPITNGGTNNLINLRVLCRECNHGKMLLNERHE